VGTSYPLGFDTFIEPTLPEETSLSSAGSGDRNHVEHHRDLGDAVEALEVNAAIKGHDHSGADDRFHGPKLLQANTHQSADTDTGPSAIHHSLGTLPNQAAAGNHTHDYNGGTILNKPLLICTSLTRPASPYFGLQIYETDTNSVRVWGQFGSRLPVPGLINGTDDFERSSSSNLGASLWDQSYFDDAGDPSDDTHGKMATPDEHSASWIISGSTTSRCIARRIRAEDDQTLTDDQIATFSFGATTPVSSEEELPGGDIPLDSTNDVYLRMSADKQSYWRVATGYRFIEVFYTLTGPAGETRLGTVYYDSSSTPVLAHSTGVVQLLSRTLSIYWAGGLLGSVVDNAAVTAKGSSNRGWGIGMFASRAATPTQLSPGNVASVTIQDAASYQSLPRWTLLPVASVPIVRLYQGVAQDIPPSGGVLEWRTEEEDNFDCFNKSSSLTDIVIKEPGLYSVDCSISWAPITAGDDPSRVALILMINNQETPRQHRRYLIPGAIGQSVDFSTKVRLDLNDRISIKAKGSWTEWSTEIIELLESLGINSHDSRLDVAFIAP